MPIYLNNSANRGEDEERRRYLEMREVAKENGLLDNLRKVEVPDELKSAYGTLVDVFMREESAVAGVWDVLQGTADEDETIGGRFVKELIGDTKLGNALGVAAPTGELWNDVLEQGGVGEGKKLSDVIGDDWKITKYVDPSMRDAAALGLAIFTSPSTYLTAGAARGAVKVVGKAGAVNLAPKAQDLVEATYRSKLSLKAQKIGLDTTRDFAELEGQYLSRVARRSGMKKVDENRAQSLMMALYQEAKGDVATYVKRANRTDLMSNAAIRLAGVPIVPLSPAGRAAKALYGAMETGRLEPVAKAVAGAGKGLDELFQRVPFGARKHEEFKYDEYIAHSLKSSSEQVAEEMIYSKFGGFLSDRLAKQVRSKKGATLSIVKYVEGGGQDPSILRGLADEIGADPDELIETVNNAISHMNALGNDAQHNGIISLEAMAKWYGRYMPRVVKSKYKRDARLYSKDGTPFFGFSGGDIGSYGMTRSHETHEEFMEALRKRGIDPEDAVELSFEKMLVDYTAMHLRAVADAGLARDTVNKFALNSESVLGDLMEPLRAAGREVTKEEAETISSLLSRNKFHNSKVGARKATQERAREMTAQQPHHYVFNEYTREIERLSKELPDLRQEVLIKNAEKDLVRAQSADRSKEIMKLIDERAQTLLEMKLVRKSRNSLRDEVKVLSRDSVTAGEIRELKEQVRAMRRMSMKIRRGKDAHLYKTSELGGQISRNMAVLRRLEGELNQLLANPKRKLNLAVDILDEIDAERVQINGDINFWETAKLLAREELDEALEQVQLAKARLKEQKGIIAETRKRRAAVRAGLSDEVVYPRAVREDDLARVQAMDPELRAAYLYKAAENVKSLEELDIFFNTHREIIKDMPLEALGKAREVASRGSIGDHREFLFTKGPNRNQRYLLPNGIADFFEENQASLGARLPRAVDFLLRQYDMLTNAFKVSHTILFPAFHGRNIISNVAAMAVETNVLAQMDGKLVYNTINAMTNAHDFTIVAKGGRRYQGQQLHNLMVALDVVPSRVRALDFAGDGQTVFDRIKGLRAITQAGGEAGQKVENFSRALYFMQMIRNGVDPVEASRRVKRVLFDYGDLSFTQREVIRRVIPFATWTMKNVELQAKNLATRTGRVATMVRLGDAGERGPEADMLPTYLRGEMKVTLKRENGRTTMITGLDLPITNINVLWNGSLGKTLKTNFGMMSPLLKNPLEYTIGMDTFRDQSIKGRKWMGQMGPLMDKALPQWAKDYFELEKIEASDGNTYYQANGTRVWGAFKNIIIGRMLNESIRATAMAKDIGNGNTEEGMIGLMRFVSGLRLEELNLDKGQKRELRRKIREVEDFLLERGLMREFTRRYIPKDDEDKRTRLKIGPGGTGVE